ncbi:hypothetical protein MB901379_04226 [Mycobacterium basiliense]|uniref:Uncharacterized protein n=1 Tax=Mycobacterium basiliense TaxID=2094119 RepID=A0A447GJI9_9MYCO|nr:hypothetical protein [Mycobacterium basiliense]VDM90624.1 hypothetical protein MB901379_04226 [Mycobacterium basiliense]
MRSRVQLGSNGSDLRWHDLAHAIRELINQASATGLHDHDRPNLTEQELVEYLQDSEQLPVTRRSESSTR